MRAICFCKMIIVGFLTFAFHLFIFSDFDSNSKPNTFELLIKAINSSTRSLLAFKPIAAFHFFEINFIIFHLGEV